MNNELVVALWVGAGIILSLALRYIPRLKDWYDKKQSDTKQRIMLVSLFVFSAGYFGIGCVNPPFSTGISCDADGGWTIVIAFVAAILGNHGVYGATKHIGEGGYKAAVVDFGQEDDLLFVEVVHDGEVIATGPVSKGVGGK